MVLPGSDEERGAIPAPESMSTSPKRSNRLHNFNLPSLKWGNQRHLRCTKSASSAGSGDTVPGSGDRRSPALRSDELTPYRKTEFEPEKNKAVNASGSRMRKLQIDGSDGEDDEEGIDAVRQKLVLDLKTAADKMKDVILGNNEEEEGEREKERESLPAVEAVKPWNLRSKGLKIEEKKQNCSSPVRINGNGAGKMPNLRSNSEKPQQRVKFSLQLTKKEIEEDFIKMIGHKPPRKPIKRAKPAQQQMDAIFPGMWLSEVTPDSYKVHEGPETSAKGRKGKGKMHVSDSDEEP